MAQFLAAQGITVHCPLLPGHGELPGKLYRVTRHQWLAEAEEGLAQLRQWADEIFLLSHSMGTVLAANLASQHPDIRGITMLAPLYKVPNRLLHLLRMLRFVMPWFYPWRIPQLRRLTRERILDLYPELDLDDPEVQAWLPAATRIPTGAIDEMRKMADLGRLLWPQLTLPVMILQGEEDIAVRPGNARAIYEQVASDDRRYYLFPNAGHELMRPFEPVHEEVWPLVYEFVRERSEVELPAIEGGD
jgi:carboxylesterase